MTEDLHPDVIAWGFARDPADPEWLVRPAEARNHFSDLFGELRVRVDGPAAARMRVMPTARHFNIHGGVHGGALLGAIDQAAFVCPPALGIDRVHGGVTIDMTSQFFAVAAGDRPFDVTVEVLRMTGRLGFVRGVVEQDGVTCMAYGLTLKRA